MKIYALVAGVLALAAPLTALAADKEATGEKAAEPGDDLGIMEKYFPFSLADGVSEQIDEIMVPVMLINLLPAGGLWGPLLFLDEENRPKFNNDILMSYLVPALTGFGIYMGGFCLFGGLGCLVTTMVGIPIGWVCGFIGCVGFVPWLWNAPIAALNAWDRAYKNPDAGDRPRSNSKKKSKAEPKSDTAPKATPPDKATGNEPYGY